MSSSIAAAAFNLLSVTSSATSLSKTSSSLTSFCIYPSINHSLPKLLSSKLFVPTQSSRIVRNLAVASSFELDEELSSDGDEQQQRSNFSPDLKVYVGNLPWNVDSAALAGLFQRAGNVEMVEVVYDKISGRSRGFGFVTMSSVQEVEAATRQFNGYELDGRQLKVNSGPPPSKGESSFGRQREGGRGSFGGDGSRGGYGGGGGRSSDTNKVYVGNLAWSVDNLALETLFQEQGNVMEARVVYDRDSGRSKGFGFVTYGSADEVNKAVESLDGLNVDGRNIRVSVAEARQRPQF
ncbi:29 kDa ribonucleoprotein A, chloroplastic-like [Rutidosis leptorrhynchoides]|uniref:29 kDa ribonucleoprotein A, chloroplastic-like n=1 Tax=Rutidosis leptorrhynchoides TaxID=125765 RepID=UPI003A98E380